MGKIKSILNEDCDNGQEEVLEQALEQDEKSKKEMEKVMKDRSKDADQKEPKAPKTNEMGLVESLLEGTQYELKEDVYSVDVKDRKALGGIISKLKENKINFKISRSIKEGYRYTLSVKKLNESQQLNEIYPDVLVKYVERAKKDFPELISSTQAELDASDSKAKDYVILGNFWNNFMESAIDKWSDSSALFLDDNSMMPMPESVCKQFLVSLFNIKNLNLLYDLDIYTAFDEYIGMKEDFGMSDEEMIKYIEDNKWFENAEEIEEDIDDEEDEDGEPVQATVQEEPDFNTMAIDDIFYYVVGNNDFDVFDDDGYFTDRAMEYYDEVADAYEENTGNIFDNLCEMENCFRPESDLQHSVDGLEYNPQNDDLFVPNENTNDNSIITAVVKEPGKQARVQDISNTLRGYQKLVGGYIESIPMPGMEDEIDIIMNDDGKALHLPDNIEISEYRTTFVGTLVAVGVAPDLTWRSLTDDEVSYAIHFFRMRSNGDSNGIPDVRHIKFGLPILPDLEESKKLNEDDMSDDELAAEEERERAELEAKIKERRDAIIKKREAARIKKEKTEQALEKIGNDWSYTNLYNVLNDSESLAGELLRAMYVVEHNYRVNDEVFYSGDGLTNDTADAAVFIMKFTDTSEDDEYGGEENENLHMLFKDIAGEPDHDLYNDFIDNAKEQLAKVLAAHPEMLGDDNYYTFDQSDGEDYIIYNEYYEVYDVEADLPYDLQVLINCDIIDYRDLEDVIIDMYNNYSDGENAEVSVYDTYVSVGNIGENALNEVDLQGEIDNYGDMFYTTMEEECVGAFDKGDVGYLVDNGDVENKYSSEVIGEIDDKIYIKGKVIDIAALIYDTSADIQYGDIEFDSDFDYDIFDEEEEDEDVEESLKEDVEPEETEEEVDVEETEVENTEENAEEEDDDDYNTEFIKLENTEFDCYINPEEFTDSVFYTDGTSIADLRLFGPDGTEYSVSLEVFGDLCVDYNGNTYYSIDEVPDELYHMFETGEAYNNDDVYIDECPDVRVYYAVDGDYSDWESDSFEDRISDYYHTKEELKKDLFENYLTVFIKDVFLDKKFRKQWEKAEAERKAEKERIKNTVHKYDLPDVFDDLDESSSAMKKSVKLGGENTQDLIDGRAIGKVKDPDERARLIAVKKLEKSGKLGDRPTVAQELKRKEDQVAPQYEKEAGKLAKKIGMTEETELNEMAKLPYYVLAYKLGEIMQAMNNEEAYYDSGWLYYWGDDIETAQDAKDYFNTKEDYEELKKVFESIYSDKEYHDDGLFTNRQDIVDYAHQIDKKLGLEPIKNFGKIKNEGGDDPYVESCENCEEKKEEIKEDLRILADINDYRPWSGAVDFYYEIVDADKLYDLEFILEDIYPEGLTMTELNDLLWFEEDWLRDMLGMKEDKSDDDTDDIDERFTK